MNIKTHLLLTLLLAYAASQCPDGTTGYNCAECPTGCDTCDTSVSTCDACTTGYYLDSSSVCNACPSNCLECSTPFSCTRCIPGYDTKTNASGFEECEFRWWKWFLIIFGILLGIFLIGICQSMKHY